MSGCLIPHLKDCLPGNLVFMNWISGVMVSRKKVTDAGLTSASNSNLFFRLIVDSDFLNILEANLQIKRCLSGIHLNPGL